MKSLQVKASSFGERTIIGSKILNLHLDISNEIQHDESETSTPFNASEMHEVVLTPFEHDWFADVLQNKHLTCRSAISVVLS